MSWSYANSEAWQGQAPTHPQVIRDKRRVWTCHYL